MEVVDTKGQESIERSVIAMPALIPFPSRYVSMGTCFYAANLILDCDPEFLPQLRALRQEIRACFGESVLSPQSAREEIDYFERQTHDETRLWGANFRRESVRTVRLHVGWAPFEELFHSGDYQRIDCPTYQLVYRLDCCENSIDIRIPENLRLNRSEIVFVNSNPGEDASNMSTAGCAPATVEADATAKAATAAEAAAAETAAAEAAAAACATVMQLLHLGWDGWRFQLPICRILDTPTLPWRGVMIDSARHFIAPEDLKRIISMAWLYKLNRLHWHLTDDQGWRLELLTYPEVCEVGSSRPGGDPNRNGFYTQKDVRDIVAYAADRGITVVPEIDLPGHVQAVLASHPEFACTPGPHQIRTEWGISEDVLCMGNPRTLEFALRVWDEVCELFPGPYVHIGGDEVPTTRWEACPRCAAQKTALGLTEWIDLHGYFIKTIAEHLTKKGKIVFGWDEVLDSTIPNHAHVMHWRAWLTEQTEKALAQGRLVVLTPYFPYYLDFVQTDDRTCSPGLAYRSPDAATLRRVYEYDPFEGLPESDSGRTAQEGQTEPSQKLYRMEQRMHEGLLGIQANAWSEFMRDRRRFEYMLFPRLLAVSETAWNGRHRSAYTDFMGRLTEGHCGSGRSIFAQRGITWGPIDE
ncbi:MAG: family 20 glycosylhydrolase [Termitinemataceae bacterium]